MNNVRSSNIAAAFQGFVFLVIMLIITPMIHAESNIEDYHHYPNVNITSADEVTMFFTLNSTDNLTSIQYQYCVLEPDGVCSIYNDMTHDGGTNYSAVLPAQEGGQNIGYKVKIEYEDGSEEYSPDKDSYHQYYVEEDEQDDDSPFPSAPLLILSMLFATIITFKRKKVRR